jgi:hypothetical protein
VVRATRVTRKIRDSIPSSEFRNNISLSLHER